MRQILLLTKKDNIESGTIKDRERVWKESIEILDKQYKAGETFKDDIVVVHTFTM